MIGYDADQDVAFLTIERIMQWVFAEQRCRMPWWVNIELSFDRGLTAKPRRRQDPGPAMAQACAGMSQGRLMMRLPVPITQEAGIVLDAVKRLPARTAMLVIKHGQARTRPDEMIGVEARLRPVWKNPEKRIPRVDGQDKYRHYGYCVLEWEVSPRKIADAREAGRLWREGLRKVAAELDGLTINGWCVCREREAA